MRTASVQTFSVRATNLSAGNIPVRTHIAPSLACDEDVVLILRSTDESIGSARAEEAENGRRKDGEGDSSVTHCDLMRMGRAKCCNIGEVWKRRDA